MSALESSFASENESPTRAKRHSLCQDLEELQDKFDGQELNNSKPETSSQDHNNNSYILPNSNNKLENEPELQIGNKSQEAAVQEQQQNDSPKTITLIEDELVSKESINASSKISQYNNSVDNQSFAQFLNIKDTSYSILIKNFEVLFQNIVCLFGDRIKSISDTYLSFLKVKCIQQKSYSAVTLGHIQNNKNHLIYIDCKSVSDQIRAKIQKQKQGKATYAKNLEELKNKLDKHLQSTIVTVQGKINKIKQIHSKLTQIGNEMTMLMIPQNRKLKKKQINPQIYSCSFIRTKYLMGKQKTYLSLMATYLQKILNFISYMCLQLQPKNCLTIKQIMMSYVQNLTSYNPHIKQSLDSKLTALSRTNCYQQIYKQVSKLLQLCVPDVLLPHKFSANGFENEHEHNEKSLKKIIEALIAQSQSLIYLPVIQLENKDYVYHSKNKAYVKWIKINHQQKYKSQTIQQVNTDVILTMEGHLILQLLNERNKGQEKMAILKLSEVKLSKKNNQIFLGDRGKGMLGYLFNANAILGSLIFSPSEVALKNLQTEETIVQQFIQKAKFVLECKKENKVPKNAN